LLGNLRGEEVKLLLRRIDIQLEQRSLRRGAIHALAASPGMSNEILLQFTGHCSLASLYRYLNWGLKAAAMRGATLQVAGPALAL
jgi:hypothetical protein